MKKSSAVRHSKKSGRVSFRKWLLIFVTLIILFVVTAFYSVKQNKPVMVAHLLRPAVNQMESWFFLRKQHLQRKMVAVKQVVVNKMDTKPDVHFEFYTTLPNMQIKAQDTPAPMAAQTVKPKIFDANKLQSSLKNEIHQARKP